jgi:hypothetical protein
MDSATGESLLEVASDENGVLLLAYHLYDARGRLVADSNGFQHFPDDLTIRCGEGEQLLHVPRDLTASVHYRLYNSGALLLTSSDGVRTKILPYLRMDGVAHNWTPPDS